jgi:uncharacterized membrane protein
MGLFSFLRSKLPIETDKIEQAILLAEQTTSAEIRVVVERKAQKIKGEKGVMGRAEQLFDELQMAETADRNGVLIYLSFKPQYVAVVGDCGIHQKVGNDFWQSVYQAMKAYCQAGEYTQALCEGVGQVGRELARYFPVREDDVNELPNEVIIK